ncbi:MAG: hypothetical protein GX811_13705, partial [Lentisphaerae bacterium]|nr:hypothetical protein [Lentisphaerota bacterium]
LVGSGSVHANGGVATGLHGAGGGGRIAVLLNHVSAKFDDFQGDFTASGQSTRSAAGTIYLETYGDEPEQGELIIKGNGTTVNYDTRTDLNGYQNVSYKFSRITLINGAVIGVRPNNTLDISDVIWEMDETDKNIGLVIDGGTVLTTANYGFTNRWIRIASSGSVFSPAGTLTIGQDAELQIDQYHEMTANIIIENGGKITHTPNPAGEDEIYKVDLFLDGSLDIKPGGSVDVTGCGYRVGYGPGVSVIGNAGGSHGGLGVNGGPCYGSLTAPFTLGSGGRGAVASAGGGAVRMVVTGTLNNNGGIYANGNTSNYRNGSGGSVSLTVGKLTGNGPITANSTTSITGDSPGGGGRVAVAVTQVGEDIFDYPGTISAYGTYIKNNSSGGAGTVYLRNPGQGPEKGTLIIDNNGSEGLGTEINEFVTEKHVGHVLIKENGHLKIKANQNLTVRETWVNNASFTAEIDGAVIFDAGAGNISTLYGDTAFQVLICTNPYQTLRFEAGSTQLINPNGRLILHGNENQLLKLRSTVSGFYWNISADETAEQDIELVDVSDSDASLGVTLLGKNSVGEHYVNWFFIEVVPGMVNTWNGVENSLWGVKDNWSLGRAPVETDHLVIPAGCINYPIFDASRIVYKLDIESGAFVFLNGYDLTVTDNLLVNGTLIAGGTETLSLEGDASFAPNTFTPVRSVLRIAGSSLQTLDLNGNSFSWINVEPYLRTVVFNGGFSADNLRLISSSTDCTFVMEAGKSVFIRDLTLLGSSSQPNIFLKSSKPGSEWHLVVNGIRKITGVDVADSDAQSGLPIPATFSSDGGGNQNWIFDEVSSVWLGTSGPNFNTAANWQPAQVPDENSRVLIDNTNPMLITGNVSLLNLTVGGGNDLSNVTINGELTLGENLELLDRGSVSLNRPCIISNSLVMLPGSFMTHEPNTATDVNKLTLYIGGNVDIEIDATVDVTGKG